MILVFSNYRTGSTTACEELAEKYNYINEDEVFSINCGERSNISEYGRLIIHSKKNVVIKLMVDHIADSNNLITSFAWAVPESAEKIYYTIRLDFEAQCKSWFVACHTDKYHDGPKNNTTVTRDMTPIVHYNDFNELGVRLFNNWILMDYYYKKYPGELIILENRNEPYTFNKEDINNTDWPCMDYIKHLTEQLKNLSIIKRSYNEAIS